MFSVNPNKEKALYEKMARFNISESDIDEQFIRSGGKGGQNVNKTSTCVYLKHRPTGIEVKCQEIRHQGLNRFLARKLLVQKIENMVLGKKSEERQRIEKIKRQKKRRSRRSKEKMLQDKKFNASRKDLMGKVSF